MEILYPDSEALIQLNREILEISPYNRRDRHGVMSALKLQQIISKTVEEQGTIQEKAATLVIEAVKAHAFESGNKRTAFFIMRAFILNNGEQFRIPDVEHTDTERNRKILTGIREGFYNKADIVLWIQNGETREFVR